MVPVQHQAVFDWIREGRDHLSRTRTPDWKGNFVSHLIPPVFTSYAKILHRIEAHYEFMDKPLSARENAVLGITPCESLKSFIERRRDESEERRILWRELADLLGVPFAPAINHEWYREKLLDPVCWPRLLKGPDEGLLSQEECEALASVLERFANKQECFFRFSDILSYGRPGQPQLFRGTVAEVAEFEKRSPLGLEYWWPADQSWVVCSDYDLEFTLVGGRRDLIAALSMDRVLECIQVDPQTRIDAFAPMP